jgi:hypothetical protein
MTATLDHLAEHHVCGCGSCKKAVEDAIAEYQKLTSEGCQHWYFTRVTINAIIVNLITNDPRVPHEVVAQIIARQASLQDRFVEEGTLDWIEEQVTAIDAANMLKAEGGKPN